LGRGWRWSYGDLAREDPEAEASWRIRNHRCRHWLPLPKLLAHFEASFDSKDLLRISVGLEFYGFFLLRAV
jgi:hypothetical protein